MSLLSGKTPPSKRRDEQEPSVDLPLILAVAAVLGGVWLTLLRLLFGVRKIAGPEQPLIETKESPASVEEENLGISPQGQVPTAGLESAHEGADLHIEKVVGIAVILALVIGLSILSVLLLFHIFEHVHPYRTSEANPLVTGADIPPRPGVVADPAAELGRVRAEENLHLDHYGWVDASHTTARIPIERAMTLWVQNGSAPAPTIETPLPPTAATNAPPISTAPMNALAAPGVTELQMRQQKATEGSHAP